MNVKMQQNTRTYNTDVHADGCRPWILKGISDEINQLHILKTHTASSSLPVLVWVLGNILMKPFW